MRNKGGEAPPLFLGRSCRLTLDRPLIMGVLNLTPDSFYDGGRYSDLDKALRRVSQLFDEGADLIDIGGESTRPGAPSVSESEERDRVVPVVDAVAQRFDLPISIDTSKSVIAKEAVRAGAEFVNDISGLTFDPEMGAVVADSGAGLFLMHTRGRPDQMQNNTEYDDVMKEVISGLKDSVKSAVNAGIDRSRIAVDPGIGFGKSVEGNLEILRRLAELKSLRLPILLGTSRKSFIGRVLGNENPDERLNGSLATVALGVASGAQILRVHDVGASREVAMMAWAVEHGTSPVS